MRAFLLGSCPTAIWLIVAAQALILIFALKAWGVLCLACAVLYVVLGLYAAGRPEAYFYPGSTGLGEWIGMGLLSLGLARVLEGQRRE